ncbi:hypothetical protein [Metamycoplasma hominis]|uniref:hypothetical protein n=1 Tax=Metamycoplasma hominis TaxID=2098 RepID=UPI00158D1A9B|nr:hypothetical protein [Metamycoplasma hominis]QKX38616.1 hypothetical protein HU156_03105 [Metamycoplasma hominis]
MKTKLKVLLSASLITAVATTAAIFATAIKSKLRKQHDLKEKYNNLKLELENLIKLAKIGNIESLNEIKALNNSKINNNSTVKEIENAAKEIEKAVESINKKIINKKHDDQIQQEMANKAKQEFIAKKNQLKKLINSSQLSNIDKLNELKKLNDININDKDLDEEIKNKTKAIEKNIDSLTKKINEKKSIEQKAQQLQEFETTKKALEELLNSEDGQKVNSDDIKKILQNNNVNNSSTNTQIIQKGNEIKKAKQDLQKLINDAKNKAKNGFDAKKQELKKLLDSITSEINKQTEDEEYKNIEVKGNASIKDIENKTKAIETAINSLTKKINEHKKIQKSQCLQNFNNAKRILEEFIKNDEDAKNDELISNLNDAKQELAKFSGINDSHEINEIKEAINSLTNAKAKLEQEIKNKKQELFNAFELSKTALQNYITNDIKDSKYKIIQDKFNNVINEYKNITSNDKISKIKDATNNLNAKFIEIGSNKAILDKFYELKSKLEDLLNTANLKDDAKSENIDLSSEDQASADSKAINNSSTIENIEQVNQKLQTAIDKLAKDIQKINDDKKAKFEEFKTEKQHLENIIKIKGLDKFINIDDEIKSINQKINEKINEYSSINQDSKISEIDDSNKKIVASQEEFLRLLDDYLSKRNELIRNHNKQKTELNSVINSDNFKQLEESKKTEFNNKKQEYEDLNLETLSKNKIQEKSQEIKELIANINKEISDAKKQEYLNFNKAKKELEKYVKDELNIQKYDSIKKDAQDKINSFSAIKEESLATKEIKEIRDATTALINAKTNAEQEKAKIDAKEQLNAKIQEADKLKEKLIDSDPTITTLKTNLEKEIANAKEALKKDTKTFIEAKEQLARKIDEFKSNLGKFNKEKETKFKELQQTRKDIDSFLTDNVKTNPNYAELVKKLQDSLKTQEKINNTSNKADIIAANQALQQALQEANDKKQEIDKFVSAKKELEEFIKNDEDAKNDELVSNLNDAKQELAKFSGINDSREINEIKEATNSLTNAKVKLEQEIKNKKQELFNAFELSKTALQNYITNDIKDSKYKIIQDKFNNVIEEYKNITSNDKILKIKDATNNLNAKFTEIGSNKAILDKFYELKPKLEDLLNTANLKNDAKSINIDLSSEDQASTDAKAINNSSTIENIEQVNQKLQTAIDKLAKDIQKINDDKKAKFEEFKTAKQHLENIIKTKGLDKFINIDDEIKSINQKINEKINEYSSINQDSRISEIDDSNKKIVASQEEFSKLLDDYLSKRNELIRNHNTEKQELQTLIDSAKAKNVDISEEINIVSNANIGNDDSIDNIRNKINKIKDAISQINSKIRAKKNKSK